MSRYAYRELCVKKLIKAGLVTGQKQGKEVSYSTTEKGQALIARYREIARPVLSMPFLRLVK